MIMMAVQLLQFTAFLLLATQGVQAEPLQGCNPDPDQTKIACAEYNNPTQEMCEEYGCCWSSESEPSCFFQTPKYIVKSISNTTYGVKVLIENVAEGQGSSGSASPISPLVMEVIQETQYRLHIKISDPNKDRWEIPESILPLPPLPSKPITYADYGYQLPNVGEEFFFAVFRSFYNTTVFNTSSIGFFYGDQFLKIGTTLPANYNLYGLGEHKTKLKLNYGQTYTLWNYDVPTPENLNLYGSHPFYIDVREGGKQYYGESYGVFLRNSNGMDVELGETSLTYKVIGGVLDFYFFFGYTPDNIVQQYHEVIGRPAMPPYWALGFHQCRWGYKNLEEVKKVVANFALYEIPLDGVWNDIDYMDQYKDFTNDPVNFPSTDMKQFIEDVHAHGQHYVIIVDPAIKVMSTYQPFEEGLGMDIFIKDRNFKVLVGKVWPGETAYPDFFDPLTTDYWREQISNFLEKFAVDGLWIDMNEPSNFCNGACNDSVKDNPGAGFNPNYPPYKINNQGSKSPLNTKTLDMDAVHKNGESAYNMHNLYGFTESIATRKALLYANNGKRPFVLSRSTFAGSGRHAAHWLGDNTASVDDLYYSIPGILNFQMFGVPLVGADICGFGGETTEELCGRWMQLGAFYPFARNHNMQGASSQEPFRWQSVTDISKKVLAIRYSLLPYYYTLFFLANQDPNDYRYYPSTGVVLKPLFFDFSTDKSTLLIDRQFLVGSALLISPQLELGDEGKSLDVYFPAAVWYDWYTLDVVTNQGQLTLTIDTPLDHIPIHVRGGYIIPMQEPGLTTTESRKNPYSLLVALQNGNAQGNIYLDDGETYNTTEFTYVFYTCEQNSITADVAGTKFATKMNLPLLMDVIITGLLNKPSVVALDGKPLNFTFSEGETFKLMVNNLFINMDTAFNLAWI